MMREGYLRWASTQGYDSDLLRTRSHWYDTENETFADPDRVGWPDGWLVQIPMMHQRRGTSPSTIKALLDGRPTNSSGCQALLRSLPIAAWTPGPTMPLREIAQAAAAQTHDPILAGGPTAAAVDLAEQCLKHSAVHDAVGEAFRYLNPDDQLATWIADIREAASKSPRSQTVLSRFAGGKSAFAAFASAPYVILSFPGIDTVMDAIGFAARADDGDSVAAVTGAWLGATHGFEVFPVDLASRLELGWVMDSLARDLTLELRENQAGSDWHAAIDPRWWSRYAGY